MLISLESKHNYELWIEDIKGTSQYALIEKVSQGEHGFQTAKQKKLTVWDTKEAAEEYAKLYKRLRAIAGSQTRRSRK